MVTFSPKNSNLKVTEKDLMEFNYWIKGKLKSPRLRKRFGSDREYEDFIMDYQDKNMSKTSKTFSVKPQKAKTFSMKKVGKTFSIKGQKNFADPYDLENDPSVINKDDPNRPSDDRQLQEPTKPEPNKTDVAEAKPQPSPDVKIDKEDGDKMTVGNLIGTLNASQAIVNIFHWTTDKSSHHEALAAYSDTMYGLVDKFAEKILAHGDIATFENEVFAGKCPMEYMKKLHDYVAKSVGTWMETMPSGEVSAIQSMIDDILNCIDQCLYRLKRLDNGQKFFSANSIYGYYCVNGTKKSGKKFCKTKVYGAASDEELNSVIRKEMSQALCECRNECDDAMGEVNMGYKTRKDAQTAAQTREASLNEVKSFSEITSKEEFSEYIHKVMKEAHGDDYSEETTNKLIEDLIKDNPDASWGELIGRATSGFGGK